MSDHEFENYLALVSRLMRLNRTQTAAVRDELRDHLETRVAVLVESGVERNDAVRQALEEFGDASSLASRFQAIFQLTQRRWIMRFTTFSIAGAFLVAVLAMAMWPSPARFGAPSSSVAQESDDPVAGDGTESPEDTPVVKTRRVIPNPNHIVERFKQPVDFQFDETPFMDIMDELRARYSLNIVLDESATDDMLTEDTEITVQVRGVSLSTALKLCLNEHNATYAIRDGVLRIISRDVADTEEFLRRQIFDCRDLLKKIEATDGRVGQLGPARFGFILGGGGQGGGVQSGGAQFGGGQFCIPPFPQQTANQQEPVDQQDPPVDQQQPANQQQVAGQNPMFPMERITAESLLEDVIKTSVSAEDWNDTNGEGTLRTISGFIVVKQNEQAIAEIESLLTELNGCLE